MFAVRLIGVLALVALNGFFAAAEFSLVAVRLSRVRQLVAKGDIRARVVERLLADLHRVVSGVQVGITLTSLAIGALGEATLAAALQQIWHGAAGTRTAFFAMLLPWLALSRCSARCTSCWANWCRRPSA
jgi:CBS domain containing-hemolysin-like protein